MAALALLAFAACAHAQVLDTRVLSDGSSSTQNINKFVPQTTLYNTRLPLLTSASHQPRRCASPCIVKAERSGGSPAVCVRLREPIALFWISSCSHLRRRPLLLLLR